MFTKNIAASGDIVGFTANFSAQIASGASSAILTIPYGQFDTSGQVMLSVFMDCALTIYDPATGKRQGNLGLRAAYAGGYTSSWADFQSNISDMGSSAVDTGLNNSGLGANSGNNGLRANGSAVVLTINPTQGTTNPYIINFTGVLYVVGSFSTASGLNSVTVLGN